MIMPRIRRGGLALAAVVLSACSTTGQSFNLAGIERIVVGRTTLSQAADYLQAQPEQVWQQGGTALARWGYKGTLATDAVYVRQELWLRFGPDGTFQRVENTINVPGHYRPRTQAEADREAQAAALRQPPMQAQPAAPEMATPVAMPQAVPVPQAVAVPGAAVPQPIATPQPLLPAGARIVPGARYPVNGH